MKSHERWSHRSLSVSLDTIPAIQRNAQTIQQIPHNSFVIMVASNPAFGKSIISLVLSAHANGLHGHYHSPSSPWLQYWCRGLSNRNSTQMHG
ncbi:hypothetical protein QC762_113785 [Podospora pseudocomata]|uniref:Uncharacterized protein n=1 Tax=Podospora pseudocomata TaxID=2093779 RepID=A0ABR0GVI7_9PEZI|nr:hypothetical protein QC762_113785 [Podospora pseudocomata]